MKYIFLTLGTKGDLNPFLGLAREMKSRGHETLILTTEAHRTDCLQAGIPFESILSAEDHTAGLNHPDAWVPLRGLKIYLQQYILAAVQPSYDIIKRHAKLGACTIVGNNVMFGGLLAHEKLGLPYFSVFLQPYSHASVNDPGKDTPANDLLLKIAGRSGRRFIFAGYFKLLNSWLAPLHKIRRALGLPKIKDIMGEWRYSAPVILNLWPDSYCAVKTDWLGKERMHQVGFVDFDRAADPDWIAQLEIGDLLERRPIVFTMGSEMNQHLDRQYDLFSRASQRLGKPGLMVSSAWTKSQSSTLDFRIITGAPYAQLFPHASVVLNHGGIGTVAKAILARRPLVTAPLAYDQFDNGFHAARHGLGVSQPFASMTVQNLSKAIEAALSLNLPQGHGGPAERSGARQACDVIERTSTADVRVARTNKF